MSQEGGSLLLDEVRRFAEIANAEDLHGLAFQHPSLCRLRTCFHLKRSTTRISTSVWRFAARGIWVIVPHAGSGAAHGAEELPLRGDVIVPHAGSGGHRRQRHAPLDRRAIVPHAGSGGQRWRRRRSVRACDRSPCGVRRPPYPLPRSAP
jgi:hypothetical protein